MSLLIVPSLEHLSIETVISESLPTDILPVHLQERM